MPRVASLYLPTLATDRLRRADARRAGSPTRPDAAVAVPALLPPHDDARAGGWRPGARWSCNQKEEAGRARAEIARAVADGIPPEDGAYRPRGTLEKIGSTRWAGDGAEMRARKAVVRERLEAEIAALPAHQRPAMRELGRRSEAAPSPFRAMPPDEAAALAAPSLAGGGEGAGSAGPRHGEAHRRAGTHVRYDLEGAFWHHGRSLAGKVARGLGASPAEPVPQAVPLLPLVTVAQAGQKLAIAAACPAAAALGLKPGTALAMARAMVPGIDVRDADPAGDAAALDRLALHAARFWTPLAAVDGEDGVRIDLSGAAHLHGGEARMAWRIRRFLGRLGFDCRVAIADTHGAAHALARHGGTAVAICPPGEHRAALAGLPVAALRIGAEAQALLRRLGIDTVAALEAMPRGPLARRFGQAVLDRLDQALGTLAEPMEPVIPATAPVARLQFAEPIGSAEAIEQALRTLVLELVGMLHERGLGARRLLLACRRVDGRTECAAIGVARPSRDDRHLLRLLVPRIETIDPGFGIEAMRLVAVRCDPLGAETIATALAGELPAPDLAPLVDVLAGRLGARRLYRVGAVESEVPERSLARAGPLESQPPGWTDPWPRPVRLLDRPERVEGVLAELPDQPPRRFTWRGRVYHVRCGDGPERIHGEWWSRPGERQSVRDYFQVEDDAGHRFWLFRRGDGVDLATGDLSWHLHGVFA